MITLGTIFLHNNHRNLTRAFATRKGSHYLLITKYSAFAQRAVAINWEVVVGHLIARRVNHR